MGKKNHQTQFHRNQIGRAQRYIRMHLQRPMTLDNIARESGSSSYHFARLFLAYTGETPFDFLRRVRLTTAMRMLQEDPKGSVTEIALSVGYETPSAFNKVFKKILHQSPTDFRNLGQEKQYEVIYDLSKPRLQKELVMNLSPQFEVITRPVTHYIFVEKHGPFPEVAPPTWGEMFPVLFPAVAQDQIGEFLGLSIIDKSKLGDEAMVYQAGVALKSAPEKVPKGMQYKKMKAGKYARFLLKGPYSEIWMAFNQIFQTLAEGKVRLRDEFCIENYLNDPEKTPEAELLTELLVPVE